MAWAFEGMSPRDWVAVLEREVDAYLCSDGNPDFRRTDKDILAWLVATGEFVGRVPRAEHLSALRKDRDWNSPLFQGKSVPAAMLRCIRYNIRMKSMIGHLVDLRFRVSSIYDPVVSRDEVDELSGIFLSKRFSVAGPGKVNVSAFRFWRDEKGRPNFEEKRVIDHDDGEPYQMRSRGSWHLERNVYLVSGITYRIPIDIGDEGELKLDAIDRVHEDRILLHHDGNPGFLRGIIASVVRRDNAPGVTEIVLDQITLPSGFEEEEFWEKIEGVEFFHRDTTGSRTERLSVRPPQEGEVEYLRLRDRHPKYQFPLVGTRKI